MTHEGSDWQTRAACRDADPKIFHAPDREARGQVKNDRIKAAKSYCKTCLVVAECFDYAIQTNDKHGILGNTTPEERAKIEKTRQKAKVRATLAKSSTSG